MNPVTILQAISTLLGNIANGITQLVSLIGNTPPALSYANPIVLAAQSTLNAVAYAFFGLIVLVTIIQALYGETVGKLYMPVGQLVPKFILTALLIGPVGGLLGQDLIIFNNLLCDIFRQNVMMFLQQFNNGNTLSPGQRLDLAGTLTLVFGLSLLRVIAQAVKRIVFTDLLLAFSGPAFLLSFHPQTAPYFAFWARTYVVTVFSQFLQFLALSIGFQLLVDSKQTGPLGYIMAVAMLNMTAEIPGLLTRFAVTAGASAGGFGSMVRAGTTAAALLA